MYKKNAVLCFLTVSALASFASKAIAGCEKPIAKVASAQGKVHVQAYGTRFWQDARKDDALCPGDMIRTLRWSRVTIVKPDGVGMRLDQNATLMLSRMPNPECGEGLLLSLRRGWMYIRGRKPDCYQVQTPYINAVHKGTEFLVAVGDDRTEITVYDGLVSGENNLGKVEIKPGQKGVAVAGGKPSVHGITVTPEDAVQWALYYPPVIDSHGFGGQGQQPAGGDNSGQKALNAYRQGDIAQALTELENKPPSQQTPEYLTLKAGLLLTLGRVDEAQPLIAQAQRRQPNNPDALSLQAIIAVTKNRQQQALGLATNAVNQNPNSSTALIALSYAQQSLFKLEEAIKSTEKATKLSPDNALAWARLSELQLSQGDHGKALKAAKKAQSINPKLSRTQTVLGFADLAETDISQAKQQFQQALSLDSTDPLARLGLGLAKIRQGDVEDGKNELETAANLDPANAIVRSYLGKAYYELRDKGNAATEYGIAKKLDPKDPTPYFYDAILKQTTNRPVEALHDMQKAIELNDNRGIYRSKLLLDEDVAARSAAKGRIYSDLGFSDRALVEGWGSVSSDPSNFSAHRFLADNYSALSRHQVARVSELLQSQLLQPINITPIQPRLAESNLLLLDGLGPTTFAFNEFNPLFQRNGLSLQASGIAGSNNTLGDELVHSGIKDNFSYSLGQYHYETDGFRANNRLKEDIYSGFAQAKILPNLSVQFEARHRETKFGDIFLNFYPQDIDRNIKNFWRTETLRGGAHYAPTTNLDLIGSIVYFNNSIQDNVPQNIKRNSVIGEGQAIFKQDFYNLIVGGGVLDSSSNSSGNRYTDIHGNAYLYANIRLPENFNWTLGASFDSYKVRKESDHQFNPKLGVTWNLTDDTTIRAAYFKTVKRPILNDLTIEPTQVAGFNQRYDDINGTDTERYGIALDQKFNRNLYGGVEWSRRLLQLPRNTLLSDKVSSKERVWRTYLHWIPSEQIALNLNYEFEDYLTDRDSIFTQTHILKGGIRYFHPSGISGFLQATYVNQDQKFTYEGKDSFALVDAALSYRLPRRYGIISFQINNIFDRYFHYQTDQFRNPQQAIQPRFFPERTFMTQLTLSFS